MHQHRWREGLSRRGRAVLKSHPDVFDAIVVGVPDARWGESIAAVVAPRRVTRSRSMLFRPTVALHSPVTRCRAISSSWTKWSARPRASRTTDGRRRPRQKQSGPRAS
jgi:hypothetical protein